jgi:hypothetical protein
MKIMTPLSAVTFMLLIGAGTPLMAQSSQRSPEQVAQTLVDAFNARNIDAVLGSYSSDSVARSLPSGEVFLTGYAEIRKKFLSSFERDPKVKVKVISRIVDGRFVIDKEKITGIIEGKRYTRYSTVIYEITGGLIRKEWYLRQ